MPVSADSTLNQPITISVLEGQSALAHLADPRFIEEWSALYERCPWKTPFQGPAFVGIWYTVYRTKFKPFLVLGRTSEGQLAGLFTLAVTNDGDLVAAGARQAEYQVWIALPDYQEAFPILLFRQLRRTAKRRNLTFHYLPPKTPLGWLESGSAESALCHVESVSRPLMSISREAGAEDSLKKKSNKSRLNRLAKLGELKFERLTTADQLREVFSQIATSYDLRQGSLGAELPFASDPLKADFHLALMAEPNLLHATVLKAGETVVAAQLGVAGSGVVHVGVLTHSPFLARHSPGKLHLIFLSQLMASEGFDWLDLTPGAAWKDRFATDHDTVSRLVVFGNSTRRLRSGIAGRLSVGARFILKSVRLPPSVARAGIQVLRRRGPLSLLASASSRCKRLLYQSAELRVYKIQLSDVTTKEEQAEVARDALTDLLKFTEAPGAPSTVDFFRAAVSRLEEGHHVYTRVEANKLVHWGWFAEGQEKGFMTEVHQEFSYPPGSGVFYDFYTQPQVRRRGWYLGTMRRMLQDAKAIHLQQVFICVLADNVPSRRAIEKIGFHYAASLFERSIAGGLKRWRTDAASSPDPQ